MTTLGGGGASIRDLLRHLPSLIGSPPPFDPDHAPETPWQLYLVWLRLAIAAGVNEPHAMVLSTVGADGLPDARTLILKDVDELGWAFASSARSVKGRQLALSPVAALTSYWPVLGRQVRLRGTVVEASADESAGDFLARPLDARAQSLLARQSQPLASVDNIDVVLAEARHRIEQDPTLVAPSWRVYRLVASEAEFLQGSPDRRHLRLKYVHHDGGWSKGLLWP
jgi:pyridoxamine 5'-phosphate oxidase